MSELITVPTFTFNQGSFLNGDPDAEQPICVDFYTNAITLRQDGDFDEQETIQISYSYLDKLFKAIKKNMPEAQSALKRFQ